MFRNNVLFYGCMTALLSIPCFAAPQLDMVIFEAHHPQPAAAHSDDTGLTIHIFDQSPALQHNAVPSERYTRPRETDADRFPVFSYSHADIELSTGYRRDDLDWRIAGANGQPNILSELKWRDLEIATLHAGATFHSQSNWLLNMDLTFGHIFNGDNQDSDYLGNNRTLEFSRSNNRADKGNILDLSAHIGRSFRHTLAEKQGYLDLIPKAGLSYHSQNLRMTDGFQTIPATGAFAGLDSSYETTWWGPWLGIEGRIHTQPDFSLGLNFEYHYAYYDATANWNLRTDFAHPKSFTHEAEGYGLVADIIGSWTLSPRLSLELAVKYQNWQADRNGVDTTFFANGTVLKVPFNDVRWRSFGTTLGINYVY